MIAGVELAAAALPAIETAVATVQQDNAAHKTALNTAADAVSAASTAAAPVISVLNPATQAQVTTGFALVGQLLAFLKSVL